MSLAAIMHALITPLADIPGIGEVYGYERVVSPATLPSVMGEILTLRYWCLSRVSTTESWLGNASVERLHRLRLRGYMAIDDSAGSERTYQDLLDAALDALGSVIDVPGSSEYLSVPWLERQEPFLLADVLPVHASEIYLLASEYLTLEPSAGVGPGVVDYRSLVDWLQGQLQSIPGIGLVHTYERLVPDPARASAIFGHPQDIRAWTLSREHGEAERFPGLESQRDERVMVRGYLTVDDPQASELVMQDLLEQMATVLRPSHTIGRLDGCGPLQIDQVAHTMLGATYLCHFAQCHLPVSVFDVAMLA